MDKKVLDKIKKCLRLAKSSNANEAATALKQAQKLMEMHGINSEFVEAADIESKQTPSGAGQKPPKHISMLVGLIKKAFAVDAVFTCEFSTKKRDWNYVVEFMGVGSSAEIAAYAYDVLLRQLKRDRTAFIKTLNKRIKTATKTRRADIYCQGWVHSVFLNITPQKMTEKTKNAVAIFENQRFKNGLEKLQTNDRSQKARRNDQGAYFHGVRDGDKVQLNQGVNGSSNKEITYGQ